VDRYPDAPAMQDAHRRHVVNMLDADTLAALVAEADPQLIVPEIEAIDAVTVLKLEGGAVMSCRRCGLRF
jgi:phosphoribosylglycinamide formyltransferase 2